MNRRSKKPARDRTGTHSIDAAARAGGGGVTPALRQTMRRAVEAYQSGDWPGAERLCFQLLHEKADHFDALGLLGLMAAQTQREAEAANWLTRAVAANPSDASSHNNLGNVLRALNRFDEALASYEQALRLKPDYAAAYLNRGVALQELGKWDEALVSYDHALAINPGYAQACNNRGNVLRTLKRLDEALASYEQAINLKPDLADAYYNRGNIQKERGRLDEAQASYEQAIRLRPDLENAYLNRGGTLQELGRLDEALAIFEQAIKLNPRYAEAFSNRGNTLQKLKRHDEALASFDLAIKLQPGYAEAFFNRGNTFKERKRLDEALADYREAIRLRPDYAEAHLNLGVTLHELARHDEALACFERAIRIRPDYAEAFCNRGVTLQELKRLDEALASYRLAIESRPEYAHAHHNLALLYLSVGDFARGWEGFEWRLKTDEKAAEYPRQSLTPLVASWNGEKLPGSLLVRNEHGVGDEIFYSGMLGDLESRAQSITVSVDPRLVPLLQRSFEKITFVSKQMLSADLLFDAEIPMGSLGRYLRGSVDAFKNSRQPYLRACPSRTRSLHARIAQEQRTICGLSWISKNAVSGANKSMRLLDLEPMLRLPGLDFVDLQYGDTSKERSELYARHELVLKQVAEIDNFNDIDGLAALIDACDVIVTVSNTTAHLAAALGKPVFLMLPFSPGLLWYWHVDRNDSPWYPSARLFRQERMGDWAGVVQQVSQALREYLESVSK